MQILEDFTDKELFDLRDKLVANSANLVFVGNHPAAETLTQQLDEVDEEITRRDAVKPDYFCCHQCYQISTGEFK